MSENSAPPDPTLKPPQNDRFPPGIPFIVGNEGAERFSFYGMKAILYIYMTALFLRFAKEGMVPEGDAAAAESHATEVVHLFIAGVYLFPLIGAVLSDRLLGKYNVIFFVSLIYCLGHGVLAVAGRLGEMGNYGGAEIGMYIGLSLIALGSGGIKPCVSANVGDQFTKENGHLVTKVFQIFYFIINFGSFFSTLITPLLYRYIGPELAFGVPGILMGIATVVFWMGRKRFVLQPPKPGGKLGAIDFTATVLLFSPFFALIYGYFVLWEKFEVPDVKWYAMAGPILGYYWPLLAVVVAAMALGLWLFSKRQSIQADDGFLAMMVYSFRQRRARAKHQSFFDPAREKFGQEAGDGPSAVLRIMVVFSMVSFFWALFDQHASTWVQQAREMNLDLTVPSVLWVTFLASAIVVAIYGGTWLLLHVANVKVPRVVSIGIVGLLVAAMAVAGVIDLIGGHMRSVHLEAAQIAALNPLMVMMIIPLLNVAVWSPLRKRDIEVKPLLKMTVGMFLAAAAFGVAAFLQWRIEIAEVAGEAARAAATAMELSAEQVVAAGNAERIPVLWQVGQYLIMTTGEVLVSVTGLEFAYTQAPRAMKSTIMGFWLLCVTFGNLIVAFLAPLQEQYELSQFFLLFAGLMVAAAIIFSILGHFYKGKTYLQDA